ncbi:MAG: TetR/AcrR family transcriptional regulator [Solirubrobacteraceae bacterium]|nr:TetR/AcrR family transcriptional regulator [Solirubrobacteraceae bacterium]
MSIPSASSPPTATAWIALTGEQKRARVLAVAGELFAREGVEFPMPELAKAVGVGVGSLYRQIGKKDDVVAALVVERLGALEERYRAAAGTDDPMRALSGVIVATVDECVNDRVTKMAWEFGQGRPDCEGARASAREALQHLIDSAQQAGALRDDASGNDLRFLFRAAREAEKIMPGGGQRLGELVLAGLARR